MDSSSEGLSESKFHEILEENSFIPESDPTNCYSNVQNAPNEDNEKNMEIQDLEMQGGNNDNKKKDLNESYFNFPSDNFGLSSYQQGDLSFLDIEQYDNYILYDINSPKDDSSFKNNNQINSQNKIKVFNFQTFKNGPKNGILTEEPSYISLGEITKKYTILKDLWEEHHIYKDETDLLEIEKLGEMFKRVKNYLTGVKGYKDNKPGKNEKNLTNKQIEKDVDLKNDQRKDNIKRKMEKDQMINIIKSKLSKSYYNATNSFDEFKKNQISIMEPVLINKQIKADFNLEYLTQKLFSILSNDSNELNFPNNLSNKEKIESIMNDNSEEKKELKNHLSLTVQNCLDIFRYKEENSNFNYFNYRLVDSLKEIYDFQKKKRGK